MIIVRILLLKLHVSSLVALASLLGFRRICFLLRFEQVNDEKRARIADLNCKIAEEEEKRQKQL